MTLNRAIDRFRGLRVGDVMNRQVVTIGAGQSMVEVAATFLQHTISAAPVIDETGCFVGILSATDFLRRDAERVGQPTGRPGGGDRQWSDTASSYMTRAVQTVTSETSLLRAAMMMSSAHIHRLPVLDQRNRVEGVVSTMDVTAAVVNIVDELDANLLKDAEKVSSS